MTNIESQSQQARTLALSIWLQCRAGSEFDQETAGSLIHAALAQREREIWINAEGELRTALQLFPHAPELVRQLVEHVIEFCRAKAQEVQP